MPLRTRVVNAFSTIPSRSDWVWTIILLFVFCLVIIPLGFSLVFLKIEFPGISRLIAIRKALVTLVFPSTAEEIFFRVFLLPHTTEQSSLGYKSLAVFVSLVLFVVYHPLNAAFFMKRARETFNSFPFLISVMLLGVVCTIAYLRSGSIYPPILIHWVIIVVWIFCFGGYQRLYP